MSRFHIPVAIMAAGLLLCASGAFAQGAEPDTSLSDFLEGLSDSTDAYFGRATAPVDTTGQDSALIAGFANPEERARRIQPSWQVYPYSWFNRVDGPVYGGGASIGQTSTVGRISGEAAYSVGQEEWLGQAHYRKSRRRGEVRWTFDVGGGRRTTVMDRFRARYGSFSTVRALFAGSDSRHYLREDGWSASLERTTPVWRGRVTYNDWQQSPLDVTARWNIFDNRTRPDFNTAAAEGRMREVQFHLTARTPIVPAWVTGEYHTSGDAIGSDFEYRRFEGAVAAEVPATEIATLVPQFMYGRVTGDVTPQSALYLGGSRTLRTLDGSGVGGTGMTLVRLDLVGRQDVLALLRIPHPDAFPIQLGAFFASGAIWGDDPYGGPTRPGIDWPKQQDWMNEAGIEALYRPGVPQTNGLLKFSYAWPLGPRGERRERYSISYSTPLDLIIDRMGSD